MANSTSSTHTFFSKGKSNNTTVHPRINAGYHNNDTSSNRSYRPRSIWRYLQQLVWNQRSTKWKYYRSKHDLYSTYSGRAVSTRNCNPSSRSSRTNRHKPNYYNKLHYYLAFSLLTVNPVTAEVNNNAAPPSTATGNVTNQAVQFQNSGSPSRQNYGGGIA